MNGHIPTIANYPQLIISTKITAISGWPVTSGVMIKKIPIDELRVGMYLHDININWIKHPFLKKNTKIRDSKTLKRIRNTGVKTVYIDTQQGFDTLEPEVQKVKQQIEISGKIKPQIETTTPIPLPEVERVTLDQELNVAKPLHKQALEHVTDLMFDIKMGKAIRADEVRSTINNLSLSVLRNQDALLTLGRIRKKSNYLYEHSLNVCVLTLVFGQWLKLDQNTLAQLATAALLHDAGEITLQDTVLQHKGHLEERDYHQMQAHVLKSVEILSNTIGITPLTIKTVEQHHERYDGSGYPAGLKGNDMSAMAQLLAICDVYDSMTSETVYRYAMAPTHVLRQLLVSENDMFESQLIKQFIKCIGIYPVGSLVKLTNGCIGLITEIPQNDSLRPRIRMIYNKRHEHFIKPEDINLADPADNQQQIDITGCVDPNQLHIDLAAFI